jgi:hypothetical protein
MHARSLGSAKLSVWNGKQIFGLWKKKSTLLEREQAKEQYELHVASHQKAMTSGAS